MTEKGHTTEIQRTEWAREPNGNVDRSTVSRIFESRVTLLVSAATVCALVLIAIFESIHGGRF